MSKNDKHVYATKNMGLYKVVNFKLNSVEHVSVYKNEELVKDYIKPKLENDEMYACTYTMFSDTNWFFLNPFHSTIMCYHPEKGFLYSVGARWTSIKFLEY